MEAQYTSRLRVARSNGPQLQTDTAPHSSLLAISRKKTAKKSSYQSLDKSLKMFLRANNLSGLEYRLCLAGYYSLGDLLSANVELLCAEGITCLMARRLLNAVDDHIHRRVELEEGANQPFKLVRKGQKIPSEPSKQMMALPTYGVPNKKRKRSVDDGRSEMSKAGAANSGSKSGISVSKIRLMSADILKQQHFVVSTLLEEEKWEKKEEEEKEKEKEVKKEEEEKEKEKEVKNEEERKEEEKEKEEEEERKEEEEKEVKKEEEKKEEEKEEEEKEVKKEEEKKEEEKEEEEKEVKKEEERNEEEKKEEEEKEKEEEEKKKGEEEGEEEKEKKGEGEKEEKEGRGNLHDKVEKEDAQFGSEKVDNMASRDSIFLPNPGSLTRSMSLPEDFQWSGTQESEVYPWYSWFHVRCYSSPGSLASPPPTTTESLMSTLTSAVEDGTVFIALQSLIVECKHHSLETRSEKTDAVAAVVGVLERMSDHPDVAVQGCRALKYLTRNVPPEPGWLPPTVLSAVLRVIDYYNTADVRVSTQACLAVANIGRADPSLCRAVLFDGGLQSLSSVMEAYHWSSKLQVAALSALAVTLASVPDGRLHVATEHGTLLDLILSTAENFPNSAPVQQYVCAFHALLLAEVSAQMEEWVVQLAVEHAVVTMATHSHDPHVTLWGAKVIAHGVHNAVLCEWKLAGRCCELLVEALANFPTFSQVQTWGAYALYQLAACHSENVCELLLKSTILEWCRHPQPTLSSEAHHYLQHLRELLNRN